MRDAGPAPVWSDKFKRQIVLIAAISISPMMQFVGRASDVPREVVAGLFVLGFVALGFALWYLFGRRLPALNEPMSERERWIATLALTGVIALIAFNTFKLYF